MVPGQAAVDDLSSVYLQEFIWCKTFRTFSYMMKIAHSEDWHWAKVHLFYLA